MNRQWLLIPCVALLATAILTSSYYWRTQNEEVSSSPSSNKTVKPPKARLAPPPAYGLYRVFVYQEGQGYIKGDPSMPVVTSVQVKTNFKWLCLNKNGTYKTSLSQSHKKPEGTFWYDPDATLGKQRIVFKSYRPLSPRNFRNPDTYIMPDDTYRVHYENAKKKSLDWSFRMGETRHDVECRWERP